MWYGLLADGELICVKWLPEGREPSLFDFDFIYDREAEYVAVEIAIDIRPGTRIEL